MKKKLNMQQIADALNVTPITVSRALNDKEGVSEELKQRIKQYAYDVGYLTKEMSKKNTSKQVNIVLLVAEVFIKTENKLYIDFYKNILDSLEENNVFGILKIIEEDEVDELIIPKLLLGDNINGMILLGELASPYVALLDKLNLPMVLLDFYDEDLLLDAVVNDNFFESYEITRHLIGKGHSDIAFVGNINSTHSIQDRYLGYYKALLRSKISIKEQYIISDRSKNGVFKELMLPSPLPSAFVCNCDEIAYKLNETLVAQGLKVPDDCSIVSFDNSKFSTTCIPQLTTMSSNLDEMVKSCVSSILNKIANPTLRTGVISVKGTLIERDSVRQL